MTRFAPKLIAGLSLFVFGETALRYLSPANSLSNVAALALFTVGAGLVAAAFRSILGHLGRM